MLDGAVYSPALLIEPTFGVRDQLTAVLPDPPVTVAVNCCVWLADSEAVAGETETETETFTALSRVMVVVLLPFNVAVNVAVWLPAGEPATALNVAAVLPGATVTDEGTVNMALLLDSDTTVPDRDADRDMATVHVVVAPEAKVVGLHCRLLTVRGTQAISKLLGVSMK